MIDVAQIRKDLDRLRSLDSALCVFGSESHRHALNPTVSRKAMQEFQARNGIALPREYCDFLAAVGNGGAGPFYGLLPLGDFDRFGIGSLADPFPYSEAWNAPDEWLDDLRRLCDEETKKAERPLKERLAEPSEDNPAKKRTAMEDWYFGSSHVNGTIPICHEGCNYYDLLVVSGSNRGTVWVDGRTSDGGIAPMIQSDGTAHTFGTWYTEWLATSLTEAAAAT